MKTTLVKTLIAAGLVSAPAMLLAQTSSVPVPQAGTTAPSAQPETPATPNTSQDAANRDSANPSTSTDATRTSPYDSSTNPAATGTNADISDSAREQFSKLDANSDGSLTQEEFAAHSQPQTTPARDASSSTSVGRNGTGPGTPGSTTGSTGGITGASNDADREDVKPLSNEELFRKLDANGDGKLSAEEYARTSPTNPDVTRDASSSTGTGRNGTGPGTPGSTGGTTGESANDNKRPD